MVSKRDIEETFGKAGTKWTADTFAAAKGGTINAAHKKLQRAVDGGILKRDGHDYIVVDARTGPGSIAVRKPSDQQPSDLPPLPAEKTTKRDSDKAQRMINALNAKSKPAADEPTSFDSLSKIASKSQPTELERAAMKAEPAKSKQRKQSEAKQPSKPKLSDDERVALAQQRHEEKQAFDLKRTVVRRVMRAATMIAVLAVTQDGTTADISARCRELLPDEPQQQQLCNTIARGLAHELFALRNNKQLKCDKTFVLRGQEDLRNITQHELELLSWAHCK